jgi:muconolactone D-isomerase
MLFFVKGELKGALPLPPEKSMELAVNEWETVLKYRQQGKALAGGALAGRKGGCGIWDVESAEELHTLVSQLPMFSLIEWEIIPLTSVEYALESSKQALKALKSSGK